MEDYDRLLRRWVDAVVLAVTNKAVMPDFTFLDFFYDLASFAVPIAGLKGDVFEDGL